MQHGDPFPPEHILSVTPVAVHDRRWQQEGTAEMIKTAHRSVGIEREVGKE